MIPSPRIAVVDDEKESVDAIRLALERLNTSCLPVLVSAGKPSVTEKLTGIRLLFLDVHLVPGGHLGAQLYDQNAAILSEIISPNNGPYVLVIWTSHQQERDALLSHISDNYPEIPHPMASVVMAKTDYQAGGVFDERKMAARIRELLKDQPQATALLHWEEAVDAACGDLMSKLTAHVPRQHMFLGTSGRKLERILTAIAQRWVGLPNLKDDRLSGVNEGLSPLLADRIAHLPDQDGQLAAKWAAAITAPDTAITLEPAENAALNAMYHVAVPSAGVPIKVGTRGAVYELPEGFDLSPFVPGLSTDSLYESYLQSKEELVKSIAAIKAHSKWCLVGLRAACDQAQQKAGLHRMILTLNITEPFVAGIGAARSGASESSMLLKVGARTFKLLYNFHYLITLTESQLQRLGIAAAYRLREECCAQIESAFAAHACRPGIVDMQKR